MVNGGLGHHIQDVHTNNWIPFFKVYMYPSFHLKNIKPKNKMEESSLTKSKASYLSLGFFSLSAGLVKTTLLIQFLRLFKPKSGANKATWSLLVLVAMWMMGFGFISWFPCFPVAKAWHPELPGRCYGLGATVSNLPQFLVTILAHSTSNFAIDLSVLGLGAVMILQLGAERPNLRIRLFALLAVGFM